LASNSVVSNQAISSVDNLKTILKNITDAAQWIEQLLAATGAEGAQAPRMEEMTAAFSNLAAVAIRAVQAVSGEEITPESVMQLLPVSTPLAAPAKQG
jgi:hypothetical protein